MNDYLTTDTDVEMGNDIDELLRKVQKLTSENDNLNKLLREKDHELSQKVAELNMENQKLKMSNDSLEELIKSYKSSTKASSNVEESEELVEKLADTENRLFLAEQSEQNTKRQNQTLNIEISNLKLEIEKMKIQSMRTSEESPILKPINVSEGLEKLDEETKNMLTELMNEIEELKKEKNEISENALNMLTEKEVENMEFREQIEELKKNHILEMNKLMGTVQDLRGDLEDRGFIKNENDDVQSLNSDECKVLLEKYKELEDEYDDFKRQSSEIEKNIRYENQKLKNDIELIENTYKNNIQDLEGEISKLKAEVNNNEMVGYHYEKEMNSDPENKNIFIAEIEHYQSQISHLEDIKEKSDFRFKEQIAQLNSDLKELDQTNSQLKQQKSEIEKELNNLKNNSARNTKEIQEKHQIEITIKEKEITFHKEKIEYITKENENLKKDYEIIKKNTEKSKNEFKELNEKLKKIKENSENEIKKLEDRYSHLEKKLENEKSQLIEQNKELLHKLNHIKVSERRESGVEPENPKNSLSDMLENHDDGNKTLLLQEEISILNNKVSELNAKIKTLEKQKNDCEILIRENAKLKNDFKEMKDTYEKHINDLQQKGLSLSTELQSTRRRTTSRGNSKGEMSLTPKQMQALSELENTISRLNAEHKFLNDKIEILTREIDSLRLLRENDVKFLREEVRAAEEQAINAKVSLATFAFEKDSELIKFKNMYKKLRMKLTAGMNIQNKQQLSKAHTVAAKK